MANENQVKGKKLTLTVKNITALESRSTPSTNCPGVENESGRCGCETTAMASQKLSAVAFF